MVKENRLSRGKDSRFSTSPSTATPDGMPRDNGIFDEALLDLVRVKKSLYASVCQWLDEQTLNLWILVRLQAEALSFMGTLRQLLVGESLMTNRSRIIGLLR